LGTLDPDDDDDDELAMDPGITNDFAEDEGPVMMGDILYLEVCTSWCTSEDLTKYAHTHKHNTHFYGPSKSTHSFQIPGQVYHRDW
jgi:hypothetical protein